MIFFKIPLAQFEISSLTLEYVSFILSVMYMKEACTEKKLLSPLPQSRDLPRIQGDGEKEIKNKMSLKLHKSYFILK